MVSSLRFRLCRCHLEERRHLAGLARAAELCPEVAAVCPAVAGPQAVDLFQPELHLVLELRLAVGCCPVAEQSRAD